MLKMMPLAVRVAIAPAMRCSVGAMPQLAVVTVARCMSASAAATSERPETHMQRLLTDRLSAQVVKVDDVSGGCGSFYTVVVVSEKFEGLSTIKQHRAVTEVLEAEIGKMHGLTIKTMTPAQHEAAAAAAAKGKK
jgi:stress-induced morphogen